MSKNEKKGVKTYCILLIVLNINLSKITGIISSLMSLRQELLVIASILVATIQGANILIKI